MFNLVKRKGENSNDDSGNSEWKDHGKNVNLLHWDDMPKHLQFNPYITNGYRPLLSAWGCLNSIFYLHNETINIFTHGKFPVEDFKVLRLLVVECLDSWH